MTVKSGHAPRVSQRGVQWNQGDDEGWIRGAMFTVVPLSRREAHT